MSGFESRVLRRVFALKRGDRTGGGRILHNILFAKSDWNGYTKENGMGRAFGMVAKKNAYRILVGKPEGKSC
jgi:hypothetical protein